VGRQGGNCSGGRRGAGSSRTGSKEDAEALAEAEAEADEVADADRKLSERHAAEDRAAAEAAWGSRCSGAYAWRPLLDAGATLVFGTDAPISPIDPIATLAAAVNAPLMPGQEVTVADALTAMTTTPSAIIGLERRAGRLSPGAYADLVVLDRDPFETPAEELGSIEVVATMVNGRWVHGRPPW
jgi:predicted amidohydrolase YtcJ